MLPYVLRYRLDFIVFTLLAMAASWLCSRVARSREPDRRLLVAFWVTLAGLVAAGGLLAEWAGQQRRAALVTVFSGFGSTYAAELSKLGHARVQFDTPADDSTYLALIATEKRWLQVNPLIADIYTFRRDAEGRIRFVVDSETDYNRDGTIAGEREQRTPIGEIYTEAEEDFRASLAGETRFETTFTPDRWGVWVSSLTPIYDEHGQVEAAVGIDYPAATWLHSILGHRAVALGATSVLIALLLGGATVGLLMRAEIAERKLAQAQLLRDKDEVDRVSRAKSEFIAVMSHEIRTPLTAVLGFGSMLADTPLNPTQQRYVSTVLSAGRQLLAMLNDILDLTQLEAGKLSVEAKPFRPRAVLDEVVDLMTARALEKNLQLDFTSDLTPGCIVLGDPARLRQVVVHLASNAIKFTDRGTVALHARWASRGVDAGDLTIEVADTGAGLTPAQLGTVFQLFSRFEAPPLRRATSSGGGLAISRQLVELMGGRLKVESELGRGSRFVVELPCRLEVVREAPSKPAPCAPAAAPSRILVVDDDRLNREILRTLLERHHYVVDVALNSAEAVAVFTRHQHAAILMDLEMPGTDGLATTALIRAVEAPGRRTPIIAVTANTAKGTRERCLAGGLDDYLTKPVYMPAVLSTLAAVIRVEKSAAAPTAE